MIPMGLITCILNPSSVKQKSIRTSSKLPSSKPQRKAVVRHGVEWRLTTGWGKSWLKPNTCRLTQTPTTDIQAQWSSQAGHWARSRLYSHFWVSDSQQGTAAGITTAMPWHPCWSSPTGEIPCNTAAQPVIVCVWQCGIFPQRNTAQATAWTCYEGRATIL